MKQRKPEIVATTCESEGVWVESSESAVGVTLATSPKRRPSASPEQELIRSIMEASMGPDTAIFCNARSSMAENQR